MPKRLLKAQALAFTPKDDAGLDALIAQIGQAQARVDALTSLTDEQKAKLDEILAHDTAEDVAFVAQAQAGAQAYIEANRERLTPKGKKTIMLKSGVIEYRAGKLSVVVRNQDAVIAGLKEIGLARFVTVKESVNKQALLDLVLAEGLESVPNIKGLSVKRGDETLEIKPNQLREDVNSAY